jgi:hypothetical protein
MEHLPDNEFDHGHGDGVSRLFSGGSVRANDLEGVGEALQPQHFSRG